MPQLATFYMLMSFCYLLKPQRFVWRNSKGFPRYQRSAGQFFNLSESQLFLAKSSPRVKDRVSNQLGIPLANLPSKYLRAPLFMGSPKKSYVNFITDTIRKKLAERKKKKKNLISFAGRLMILVKHVLASNPLHVRWFFLCQVECEEIERILSNFLWSACEERTKRHCISWHVVCLPKNEGGLGLRRLKELNDACLLKLGWRGQVVSR